MPFLGLVAGATGAPVTIHLHLYNPTVEAIAILAGLEKKLRHVMLRRSEEIVSLDEYGGGPVCFPVRDFIAYQLLRANDLPVVAVDIDICSAGQSVAQVAQAMSISV